VERFNHQKWLALKLGPDSQHWSPRLPAS